MDLSNLIRNGWKELKGYPTPNYPEYGHHAKSSIFTIIKFYGEYEVHVSVHPKGGDKYDVVSCAEHRCTDPSTNIESRGSTSSDVQSLVAHCCTQWDNQFA